MDQRDAMSVDPLTSSGLLTKDIWKNQAIDSIINSTIVEYDVKGAHLMCMKILFGDDVYNKLSVMSKLDRNIAIGNKIKVTPGLSDKIRDLVFEFKRKFIVANKLTLDNIVETTKDSLVLARKIPKVTKINVKGTIVEFRDKNCLYTSFYKLGDKSILYDSMSNHVRIKGIREEITNESPFINEYYTEFLSSMESSISMGTIKCMSLMKTMREMYVDSDNMEIYRFVEDGKFYYDIMGEVIATDVLIDDPEAQLLKQMNYVKYVLPLMRNI